VTITIGELEPEFVSYATLRRHTFCFKGMKRCEFDHDPTDSRALPILTPAPRTVTCSTVVFVYPWMIPSAFAACACAVVRNASVGPLHVCSGGFCFRIFFVYSFG
jgi:hypothetical protein